MKRIKLGPIDNTHDYLSEKSSAYKKWHSGKLHHFAHWAVFIILVCLTVTFSLTSIPKHTKAGGPGNTLIDVSLNKTSATADGSDAIDVTVYNYLIVCDSNPNSGEGFTYDGTTYCQQNWGGPAYHKEAEGAWHIGISVNGSGNTILPATTITSDINGLTTFKVRSTFAETKTITILNMETSGVNDWGSNGIKTITFTAPPAVTPAPSQPSSGTSSQKTSGSSSGNTTATNTPTAPGVPAVPVLENLRVGNTQFAADKIQENKFKEGDKKVFSGTTIPNGIVHLYFHSSPFEATTTADKDGKWTYELTKDLGAGEHTMQLAVTDPATNKTSDKSNPIKFTVISEAKAASPITETAHKQSSSNILWYVLSGIIAVVMILAGLESYLYFAKGKGLILKRVLKKKNQTVV